MGPRNGFVDGWRTGLDPPEKDTGNSGAIVYLGRYWWCSLDANWIHFGHYGFQMN